MFLDPMHEAHVSDIAEARASNGNIKHQAFDHVSIHTIEHVSTK